MKEEIVIAGFGGQGVLSMGKILAREKWRRKGTRSWVVNLTKEQSRKVY